jgi:large subunit ribosomal protein L30
MAKKTLTVKLTGSPTRRPDDQRKTLVGLGLRKLNGTRVLEDTPSIRGMIAKVAHMVKIVEPSN